MPTFKFGTAKQTLPPTTQTITPGSAVSGKYIGDNTSGGRTIAFPMKRDKHGDFESVTGAVLVGQQIVQTLATRRRSGKFPGDIPSIPEFGSRLHLLVNLNLDETTRALAETFTRQAINTWVKLANIAQIIVTLDSVDNAKPDPGVVILIKYRLASERASGRIHTVEVRKTL